MAMRYGHSRTVNIFGSLGYLSVFIQWLWISMIIAYPYLEDGTFSRLLQPSQSQSASTPVSFEIPLLIALPITILVTIVIIVVMVVTLVRLPKAIGKTSSVAAHLATDRAASYVSKHTHMRVVDEKKLSYRALIILKCAAVLLPLAISFVQLPRTPLEYTLVIFVSALIAFFSLVYFGLQYLFARLARVNPVTIW